MCPVFILRQGFTDMPRLATDSLCSEAGLNLTNFLLQTPEQLGMVEHTTRPDSRSFFFQFKVPLMALCPLICDTFFLAYFYIYSRPRLPPCHTASSTFSSTA